MDQPKQPSILESMTNARDYWYGRAIALEHELETLKKPHAEPYKEGYMLLLADHTSLQARITELEARLSQTWQPLPDGEVGSFTYIDNGGKSLGVYAGNDYTDWYATDDLPDNIRLCRLVELVESQPTYSHRNGETEPPTVNGWYWYYHEDDWYGMYHVTGDRYELGPISGVLSEEFEGQWWGPVVAPWEADDE